MKILIRNLIVTVAAGLTLLSLTSCIGIDSTLAIKDDGSGTIQISYVISKLVANLGRLEETDTTVPLPVGREDFDRTVQRTPGLVLTDYKESEDEENVIIEAEMTFASIASLNSFLQGNGEEVIRLEQSGGRSTLVFDIYPGREGELADSDADVLAALFQGYSLNFVVEAPDSIQENNIGTQSTDGNSVRLELPVSELITENKPVTWEISW